MHRIYIRRFLSLACLTLLLAACGEETQRVETPMDENNPENAENLKAYLQRESMHDTMSGDFIVTNDLGKLNTFLSKGDTIRSITVDSCTGCTALPDHTVFGTPRRLKKTELGYVRVRSNAECFETATCVHNVIGKITDGHWVNTSGPVKNIAGIAYNVVVKDKKGKCWKGYISATCFE